MRVEHPRIAGVTQDVADSTAGEWIEAGWVPVDQEPEDEESGDQESGAQDQSPEDAPAVADGKATTSRARAAKPKE